MKFKRVESEVTDKELCCLFCGEDKKEHQQKCKRCSEVSQPITKFQFRKNVTLFIESQQRKYN